MPGYIGRRKWCCLQLREKDGKSYFTVSGTLGRLLVYWELKNIVPNDYNPLPSYPIEGIFFQENVIKVSTQQNPLNCIVSF